MTRKGWNSNCERLKHFNKIWASLLDLNCPVIVEGKRDKVALRILGYDGSLVKLNDGKSLLSTIEKLSRKFGRGSEFVILMDWDRTGDILAKRLKEYGESCALIPNIRIRQELSLLCSKDIACIEELPTFVKMLNSYFENIK